VYVDALFSRVVEDFVARHQANVGNVDTNVLYCSRECCASQCYLLLYGRGSHTKLVVNPRRP
jgi:hypothetical protein